MARKTPHPPGPRGDFFLGSTLDFKERPLHFVHYLQQAYGDVTRFRVGAQWWYLLAHPDDINDTMRTRRHLFRKPKIARRLWDKFLGHGLLTAEGSDWKRLNKLVRPAFHHKRVVAYADDMVVAAHALCDRLEEGQRVDFDEQMVALTLEVVAKTLFDADVRRGASQVGEAMHVLNAEMIEHLFMPLPVPRWWPSARNKRKLSAISDIECIVKQLIDERRASTDDRGDLLSMLVHAKDETGRGLSDKEVRDQAMTLFFAGHETTAHALTWAWYLLATHPEVTERLQSDLARVTGGERLQLEHLSELDYLERCVKESLRILPSVWVFMKEPVEDVEVGGFVIPQGSQILLSPWVTHHDPRWYPSPETFDPDRFLPEREATLPRGAYIPFSGGQRECLGKAFAMMEMRLILGSLLQRLQPRIPAGHVPVKHAALSMHPQDGLPVEVLHRVRRQERRSVTA